MIVQNYNSNDNRFFYLLLLRNRNNRFAFIPFGIKTNCDRNDVIIITYELLNAKQYYALYHEILAYDHCSLYVRSIYFGWRDYVHNECVNKNVTTYLNFR